MTATPATDLAGSLDALAAGWGALSRLFLARPDVQLLSALDAPGQLEAWPLAHDEQTVTGLDRLRTSFDVAETTAELDADYNALFLGPSPLYVAPYESVHRSIEHLMFEAETLEVRSAYAEAGLASATIGVEPDDHIGLEFGFLAHLCLRALDQLDAGDPTAARSTLDTYGRFLDEHVLPWAPGVLRMVQVRAATHFYRGVAALALGALDQSQRSRP